MTFTATYSPDDNKLRLYSTTRLDREIYDRVKAAGFHWAPKQDLFVAPMWTPARADLLLELCGEIDDEDTSLCERAEERAERFEEYGEKRAADAVAAHASVEAITSGIPMGQPILVGHHSEKHARRDAERIEAGMRKTIKMWETSQYWERRAKGALQHAKYKELPGVRHRRIKGLEADRRRHDKSLQQAQAFLKLWAVEPCTKERALKIANYGVGSSVWSDLHDDKITAEEARSRAVAGCNGMVAHAERWIAHIDHRLTYERAMLGAAGGLPVERLDVQIGGRVLVGRDWLTVIRINKSAGVVTSYTTNRRFVRQVGVEEVLGVEPPAAGAAEAVAASKKLAPLVNHPGDGFYEMTGEEWKRAARCGAGQIHRKDATDTLGACRYRTRYRNGEPAQVYVTDLKRTDRPALGGVASAAVSVPVPPPTRTPRTAETAMSTRKRAAPPVPPVPVEALRAQLKAGVHVVTAPQLFPTPEGLASRMVALADLRPGHRVLEPSAGTGNLVRAIVGSGVDVELVTVEIDPRLARLTGAACADFLACKDLGTFDRILMNPPFHNGADLDHIQHARSLLRPGGRIIALCAAGPRQKAALEAMHRQSPAFDPEENYIDWELLPEGSFKEQGTGVRVYLCVIEVARAARPKSLARAVAS